MYTKLDKAKQCIKSAIINEIYLLPATNITLQKNNLNPLATARNTTYSSDKSPLSLDFFIIYNWGNNPIDSEKIPSDTKYCSVKYVSPGLKKKT